MSTPSSTPPSLFYCVYGYAFDVRPDGSIYLEQENNEDEYIELSRDQVLALTCLFHLPMVMDLLLSVLQHQQASYAGMNYDPLASRASGTHEPHT